MPLTLSLAGISITFDKFLSTDYPRITVQPLAAVEFSVLGTPAVSGSYHEPKFIWSVNAICSLEQRYALEALAYEFNTRRRTLQDSDILIYDTTARVVEAIPRTRAIAPSTTEVAISSGHICYYPVFKAALTETIKFSELGHVDSVQFTLVETVKVPS